MKKALPGLIIILLFSFTSCKPEWNKERARKMCKEAAKAGNSPLSDKELNTYCDCMSEKMLANFKTEDEANKNITTVILLSKQCAEDLKKNTNP